MTNEPASTTAFPSWTFTIPADVVSAGFQIAIYGQDPSSSNWYYWDFTTSAYVQFPAGTNGQYITPLQSFTAQSDTVNLPASQQIQSGVVAMFIGGSSGIPVTSGIPASPTTGTNGGDVFSIFEFTYATPTGGSGPILDIDISNIDQVGFTYAVTSTGSVPFPMASIGSSVAQKTLFDSFTTCFPAGTPFNECLVLGQSGGTQLRLVAPQDVLQAVTVPVPPSYLAPGGVVGTSDPFADNSYFYLVSETSPTGETVPNQQGVFGGFLLNSSGQAAASQISIGWLVDGNPGAYVPVNPTATGINIYRAPYAALEPGTPPPAPAQTSDYKLITSQSISAWNKQSGDVYVDSSPAAGTRTPCASSYGFSALSTWFDQPLRDFFAYYMANSFQLYQFNQAGGSNGTLWTGNVQWVWPNTGQPITAATYIDEKGKAQPIAATWQWGDGTQAYLALQLVGNAYDSGNYSNSTIAGQTGLSQGEYQGAVVNIYFPYFIGNTGLGSVNLPATLTNMATSNYALSNAPTWMNNATNDPSQMVFGCAGVFATPNDPDAVAQGFSLLATNALTNIENVIVSALNRGVATGYGFQLGPQQYTCLYAFTQAPQVSAPPSSGGVPAGTYTYYLSALLNNGGETALTWGQTVTLSAASTVSLAWGPIPSALYTQANVYRQGSDGTITLVGTVANTSSSQAQSFQDVGATVTQPTNGAPYSFYPSWNDAGGTGYVPSNLYSAFLHQNSTANSTNGISINGLAYGYPFDDQGGFSTNINYGTAFPSSVTFTISSLT
ncbi:hypothetical protein [Niveispirillum sp. KHB5.9]|uniref:hypothetical protein n=1 Tax=Niveispirillum sp. KHB5.9 TaxID=3400269 RepID=UPI003A845885